MKKNILLFCTLMCAITCYAQFKVGPEGTASLGDTIPTTNAQLRISNFNNTTQPQYGVFSECRLNSTMPTGTGIAVVGYADGHTVDNTYPVEAIGVLGMVQKSGPMANRFGAGVVGLANYYNGIGIYGSIVGSLPNAWPKTWNCGVSYAGYFAGSVNVSGTVTAAVITNTSDYRLKENIQSISSRISDKLCRLQPVTYKLREDSTHYVYLKSAKEMNVYHYGFIAQELQELFPELVYEDGEGYLSINYTEIIPLLVSSIQELTKRIKVLETQGTASVVTRSGDADYTYMTNAILSQNEPNPASSETTISYQLPITTSNAQICIYDLNGRQINSYALADRGNGQLVISANEYEVGMYLYSLIVDGQIIDTKRMILTK